jgi:hypothetical protein
MTAHPYAPFIQWVAFSYFRGSWHDLDIPKPTMAWIRSFGVTAARIDRFLKLGHSPVTHCRIHSSWILSS